MPNLNLLDCIFVWPESNTGTSMKEFIQPCSVFVFVIKWSRVKLGNNFTSIPFDYLLISWLTNYVSNLRFLTYLSWIVSIENSCTLSNV